MERLGAGLRLVRLRLLLVAILWAQASTLEAWNLRDRMDVLAEHTMVYIKCIYWQYYVGDADFRRC